MVRSRLKKHHCIDSNKWSMNFDKRSHSTGAGTVNVTLASREPYSWLQQSCWWRFFCCIHHSSDCNDFNEPDNPKKLPLPLGGSESASIVPGAHPNLGLNIGSAVLTVLMNVTNRHRHHTSPSVATGRIYLLLRFGLIICEMTVEYVHVHSWRALSVMCCKQ